MKWLGITEDMTEDRKQWRRLVLHPTPGVGYLGRNEDDDDDDETRYQVAQ